MHLCGVVRSGSADRIDVEPVTREIKYCEQCGQIFVRVIGDQQARCRACVMRQESCRAEEGRQAPRQQGSRKARPPDLSYR